MRPLLAGLLLLLAACGAYRGTVIDSESGRPLPGAVVVLVWCKHPVLTMDYLYEFHAGKETVTDSDGRFAFGGWRRVDWNPRTVAEQPDIAVSMVGYHPVTAISRPALRSDLLNGGAVKLTRLPPGGEAGRSCTASTPCANGDGLFIYCGVPRGELPQLGRSLRAQRELESARQTR
jgi:hypothetical protein